MIIIKNNYYLYIENLKDINLDNLRVKKKINIIYRNPKKNSLDDIIKFKKKCETKQYKFYVANDEKIAIKCNASGVYISAFNKKKFFSNIAKIGAAHNIKEINLKIKQNCKTIILSRLFRTNYINKKSFLGIVRFNLLAQKINRDIIPLGGINSKNLLKLNLVNSNGLAILSSIKKKPVITNRLF